MPYPPPAYRKPFNFSAGNFDVSVQSTMTANFAAGLGCSAQVGVGLLRFIYEYRSALPMTAGTLDGTYPLDPIAAMDVQSRHSIAPAIGTHTPWPLLDGLGALDLSVLNDDCDAGRAIVVVVDPAGAAGNVSLPELKAICEALDGTYTEISGVATV